MIYFKWYQNLNFHGYWRPKQNNKISYYWVSNSYDFPLMLQTDLGGLPSPKNVSFFLTYKSCSFCHFKQVILLFSYIFFRLSPIYRSLEVFLSIHCWKYTWNISFKPLSLFKTFLRILVPRILMFFGLWRLSKLCVDSCLSDTTCVIVSCLQYTIHHKVSNRYFWRTMFS